MNGPIRCPLLTLKREAHLTTITIIIRVKVLLTAAKMAFVGNAVLWGSVTSLTNKEGCQNLKTSQMKQHFNFSWWYDRKVLPLHAE
jgi:hypothetical protein